MSTTDLRTRSSELVENLKAGLPVQLIHRSEVIGVIAPARHKAAHSPSKLHRFLRLAEISAKTGPEERNRRYAKHLNKKYGQGIS